MRGVRSGGVVGHTRLGRGLASGVVASGLVLAGCGDTATPSRDTPLPPLPTVTTTILVTTTLAPVMYGVQPGDTLDSIAERFGVTRDMLIAANGIVDANRIEVGQQLIVPPPPVPPPSSAP